MGKEGLESKFKEELNNLLDVYNQTFFLEDQTIELEERRYGEVSLLSLLTILNNGNMLLKGEYGSGKTTSFERLSSLVYGLPLEYIQHVEIHGNPEVSEDKIKAKLNFGKLQKGEEEVEWRYPVFSPVVMVDEVNRLPSRFQNMLLNEVDRSIWSYRMETIFSRKQTFFATMNRPGPGTSPMTPALLERFDVSARTLIPLSTEHRRKMREKVSDLERILKDEGRTKETLEFMKESQDQSEIRECLETQGDEFKKKVEAELENYQIRIPRAKELERAKREVKEMELNTEANQFLDYFKANVNMCVEGEKEDFSACPGCDKEKFPCSKIRYFSNRAEESITDYSKSLAWLVGKEKVDLETMRTLLPYVLKHRVEVNETELEGREFESKGYWRSKKFRFIKEIVEEDSKRFLGNLSHIKDISKAYLKDERLPKKQLPSPWYKLIQRSK